MKEKEVWITGLQETRIGQDSRESRKEYTWYFSGEKHKDKKKVHGVGCVINNKIIQHIEDIEPINERIMTVTLKAILPIKIIICYAPIANRDTEEKE